MVNPARTFGIDDPVHHLDSRLAHGHVRPKSRRPALCGQPGRLVAALLLILFATSPAVADPRERAVEQARAGDTDAALEQLVALHEREPSPAVLHDLVTVADWHGDHQRAIDLAPEIDPETAPDWALGAMARSLRALERHGDAARWFDHCALRSAQPLDCSLAAATSMAAAGNAAAAEARMQVLDAAYPVAPEIAITRARIREAAADWAGAAEAWAEAARLAPGDRTLPQAEFEAHMAAGNIDGAAHLAAARGTALQPEQVRRLRTEETIIAIRSLGGIDVDDPGRATRERRVVVGINRSIAEAEPGSEAWARARFDEVVARQAVGQPRVAVRAWERLGEDGLEPPAYVIEAACSAMARIGDPRHTKCLEQLVAADPAAQAPRRELFFAYFDAERYREALQVIDDLAAADPQGDDARTAAVARAWLDRLPAADRRLADLDATDPEVGTDHATIHRWRGWPQRALRGYENVLAEHPGHAYARIGAARAQMDLGEHHRAGDEIERLATNHPRHPALAGLRRDHARARGWGFSAEIGYGWNNVTAWGSREVTANARLESPLITDHGRVYIRHRHDWARFPEGNGTDRRHGFGWHHRSRNWTGFAEFHTSTEAGLGSGVGTGLEWTGSDHWRVAAGIDTNSAEVPLRARRQGIGGELAEFATLYRWHERRRARIGLAGLDIDDGNRRRIVSASLTQRLHTRPRGWLDAELGLYGSTNTAEDAAYFNPESDFSATLALTADWRNRIWFRQRLRQRVTVHGGSYSQKNFASAAIWGVRYEHRWATRAGNGWHYGIGTHERVYDGDPERGHYVWIGYDWRLPSRWAR